jgi:two-component system cell cycle response regulator
MHSLTQAWNAADRSGQPLAVLLIDIDHFKKINDNHGHAIGDIMLKEVGKVIQGSARKDDRVCRLGGEEFLVICGNADENVLVNAADQALYGAKNAGRDRSCAMRNGTLLHHQP